MEGKEMNKSKGSETTNFDELMMTVTAKLQVVDVKLDKLHELAQQINSELKNGGSINNIIDCISKMQEFAESSNTIVGDAIDLFDDNCEILPVDSEDVNTAISVMSAYLDALETYSKYIIEASRMFNVTI